MNGPKFFVWKPEFALGVPVVDAEHQRFFELINELYAAMLDGSPPPRIKAVFES